MVLGGGWDLLGVSWGTFSTLFFKALLPRGPKRAQETAKMSLGLDLGRFWRGFGKVLGGQNNLKIEILVFFWTICMEFGCSRLQSMSHK